jgi:5-methylcytosine-specific restriction endonuclease McrA
MAWTKLRFSILRRDSFRCYYCGESAPDVVLHVDHVIPRALGGTSAEDEAIARLIEEIDPEGYTA